MLIFRGGAFLGAHRGSLFRVFFEILKFWSILFWRLFFFRNPKILDMLIFRGEIFVAAHFWDFFGTFLGAQIHIFWGRFIFFEILKF